MALAIAWSAECMACLVMLRREEDGPGPAHDGNHDGFQPFEHLREQGLCILRSCGLWAATRPVADLCVAMTQAKVMAELRSEFPDPRITLDQVVPAMGAKQSLTVLLELPDATKIRTKDNFQKCLSTLTEWLWRGDLEPSLHETCHDVFLLITDAHHILERDSRLLN